MPCQIIGLNPQNADDGSRNPPPVHQIRGRESVWYEAQLNDILVKVGHKFTVHASRFDHGYHAIKRNYKLVDGKWKRVSSEDVCADKLRKCLDLLRVF